MLYCNNIAHIVSTFFAMAVLLYDAAAAAASSSLVWVRVNGSKKLYAIYLLVVPILLYFPLSPLYFVRMKKVSKRTFTYYQHAMQLF